MRKRKKKYKLYTYIMSLVLMFFAIVLTYYTVTNIYKTLISGSGLLILLTLIFPGILFFCSIFLIVSYNKKEKLIQFLQTNGILFYANYVETAVSRSRSSNRYFRYYVCCEFVDATGHKFEFRSEEVGYNPEKLIQENFITKFKVYVDKDDSSAYLVDLSLLDEFYERKLRKNFGSK